QTSGFRAAPARARLAKPADRRWRHIGDSRPGPQHHQPLNQRVPGSSPGAPTSKINHLTYIGGTRLPKKCVWEEHGKIAQRQNLQIGFLVSCLKATCSCRFDREIIVATARSDNNTRTGVNGMSAHSRDSAAVLMRPARV